MTPQLENFFDDPHLRAALRAIDDEARGNPDAGELLAGLEWICAQQRTTEEKLIAIEKLLSLKGHVHIPSMLDFCGWNTEPQKSPIEQFIDEIVGSKQIAAAADSGALKITQPDLVALFSLLRWIDRGDRGAEMREKVNGIVMQENDVRKKCGALLPLLRPLAVSLQ